MKPDPNEVLEDLRRTLANLQKSYAVTNLQSFAVRIRLLEEELSRRQFGAENAGRTPGGDDPNTNRTAGH